MKKTIFTWAMALALPVLILSCSKDDDDDDGNSLEYIDQNLQGMIAGQSWEFQSGSAEEFLDSTELSFNLRGAIDTNECDFDRPDGNFVLFFAPNTTGQYTLGFNATNSRTVTLYDDATDLNNVATEGKFELTSINRTTGVVTGRMVARIDADNTINGNFTVSYCD